MRRLAFVALMLVLVPWSPAAQARSGQAPEGREAFIALKCTTCHKVLGDALLPAPASSQPGPVLGGLNEILAPEELAVAITTPSHSIAPGFRPTESGLSPMGDWGDVMTTNQLLDIVAYLQEQTEKDSPWPKEGL